MLFYNQYIYRNKEDDNYDECEFVSLLHFNEQIICECSKIPFVFKLATALTFIDKIKENFIYSKFHDGLVLKSKYDKQFLIAMEEESICKREINECIVCYEIVSSELQTGCCKKHICRICVENLTPQRCPN